MRTVLHGWERDQHSRGRADMELLQSAVHSLHSEFEIGVLNINLN
jgi:hypothetical protein